jgi:hypothetical protein
MAFLLFIRHYMDLNHFGHWIYFIKWRWKKLNSQLYICLTFCEEFSLCFNLHANNHYSFQILGYSEWSFFETKYCPIYSVQFSFSVKVYFVSSRVISLAWIWNRAKSLQWHDYYTFDLDLFQISPYIHFWI